MAGTGNFKSLKPRIALKKYIRQRLLCHISVGDIGVIQSFTSGQVKQVQRVLQQKRGSVKRDAGALALFSVYQPYQFFRAHIIARLRIRRFLADGVVLAPRTGKVAAPAPHGQGTAAWVKMEERLFFDGIGADRRDIAVFQRVQSAVQVLSCAAKSGPAGGYGTQSLTGAAYNPVISVLIEEGFFHTGI